MLHLIQCAMRTSPFNTIDQKLDLTTFIKRLSHSINTKLPSTAVIAIPPSHTPELSIGSTKLEANCDYPLLSIGGHGSLKLKTEDKTVEM